MKGRVIVLNETPRHAALVVDGVIEDLLLDGGSPIPMPGEIHLAQVDRIVQGAAFVDCRSGHMGYLRDVKSLKGQREILIQISSVAEAGKAIPVDRRLLIKGRNLILTPAAPGVNVSRQIRDPEERDRLTETLQMQDDEMGVIIRSAAKGASKDVLLKELELLRKRHSNLSELESQPAQLFSPDDFALREWTSPLPDMIAVSDKVGTVVSAHPLLQIDAELRACLEPGDGDPFDHFGVWDEIEKLKSLRTELPSGGWMAIEATRAMVTVDVNTGDQFGGAAGMTANVEAARELPRQLRLRGLGGQVIVDFAPMKKLHRRKIEETLKTAFRRDPIETSLAGWTPLGNFELQRKRERRPLSETL